MRCPGLAALPAPPPGRTGWPWTEESPTLGAPPTGAAWPRLSIVTPSYNQGQYIEETIRSVLLQGYPDVEYILIDGGSTDKTVEIIHKYETFLTHWASEKDRGQYHAINKGLDRCSGDVFNWINSDDLLCPGAFAAIAEAWISHPGRIIAGPVIDFGPDGTEDTFTPSDITVRRLLTPADTGHRDIVFHQPGTYLPLDAVKQVGCLREEFSLISDLILLLKVLRLRGITYVAPPLARFRLHASSKTVSQGYAQFAHELAEAIQTLDGFNDILTPARRREMRARASLLRAGVDLRAGRLASVVAHGLHAMSISTPATLRLLARRIALLFRSSPPGGQSTAANLWPRRLAGDLRAHNKDSECRF